MGSGANNPRNGSKQKTGATQKKAGGGHLGGNPNQAFHHPFTVRGDATPGEQFEGGNSEVNYDVLGLIAAEWLRLNPNATAISRGDLSSEVVLKGSSRQKIQAIVNWIAKENKLVDKAGNLCDGVKFKSPVIYPGLKLDLPLQKTGNTNFVVNPEQGGPCGSAMACLTKNPPVPSFNYTARDVVPVAPVVPPKAAEKPAPLPEAKPHYTARQSARASEGAHLRPGSVQWALETRAMLGDLGDDLTFSKEHWSLKNITPNKRAKREKWSSETEHFNLEGDQKGKNRLSRADDQTMDNTFRLNGKARRLSDKGRSFTNGYVASVDENGVMERSDEVHSAWVHGGNYAIARDLGVIDFGYMNVPVGAAVFKPSKQFPIFAETARYGLTQSHAAISEVNLGGKHAMVADQRSWITNPMESPDRINADTLMKADQRELEKQLSNVEKATTPEAKKAAALAALVALRDIKDNPVMKAADARTNGPLAESEKAIKRFLTDQKLDAEALSREVADLTKHPRFVPAEMSAAEKQAIIDSGVPSKRLSGVTPDLAQSPVMKALVSSVFTVQNSVELDIAKGNSQKLTEAQAIDGASKTLKQIAENAAAAKAYGAFLKRDQSAGVEYGQALHDILRNPENYALPEAVKKNAAKYGLSQKEVTRGVFTEEASVKWVQELLGDTRKKPKDRDKTLPDDKEKNGIPVSEAAFDDVYRNGRTPRAPFVRNKPVPVSRPELIGEAAAAQIESNPQLFKDFVEVVTTPVHDKKTGLHDGRRYALGLVHALGGERAKESTGMKENEDAPAMKAVLGALNLQGDAQKTFRAGVRDVTAYTESGAAGYEVGASVRLDNTLVAEQNKARAGDVDVNRSFRELFTSDAARNADSDRLAVEALKAHPGLARDVVLATMLRNPQALKAVEAHLKTLDKSLNNKLEEYGTLRSMIADTRVLAEQYQKASGGDKVKAEKALNKAVEAFGAYFAEMEADLDRAEKLDAKGKQGHAQVPHNKAAQKAHAWSALMDGIGGNDAMSAAMVETMGKHTALRDAFLAATTDAVYLDNQHIGHIPGVKGTHSHGDAIYQSAFFTLPTDKKGAVDTRTGLFGLAKRDVTANAAFIQAVLKGNNDIAQSAALVAPKAAPAVQQIPPATAELNAKIAAMKLTPAVEQKLYAVLNSGALDGLAADTKAHPFPTKAADPLLAVAQQMARMDSSLAGGKDVTRQSELYQAVKALADQELVTVTAAASATDKAVKQVTVGMSDLVARARAEKDTQRTAIVAAYTPQIAASGATAEVQALMGSILSSGALQGMKVSASAASNPMLVVVDVASQLKRNAEFAAADMVSLTAALSTLQSAGILEYAKGADGVLAPAVKAPQQAGGAQNQEAGAVAVTSAIHQLLTGHHGRLEQVLAAEKDGKPVYMPAQRAQVRAHIAAVLEKEKATPGFLAGLAGLNQESPALSIARALAVADKQFGNPKKLDANSPLVKALQAMKDAGILAVENGHFAVKGVALTEAQEAEAKQMAAAMQASGVLQGNALGTNPAIFLGKLPEGSGADAMQQAATAALTKLMLEQAKTNPLLQGKIKDEAGAAAAVQQLIGSGAIQFAMQGGDLVAVPNQQGVGAVTDVDGKLNVGVGLDTRLLLLALTPFVPPTSVIPTVPKVIPPYISPDYLSPR